jgi:hypothetical protein
MALCAFCNGRLERLHRTRWQKILFQSMFKCAKCGEPEPVPRKYTFLFGLHARCPSCGTGKLTRMAGRDRIDRMFHNPFSYLQRAFGGKLFHCSYCRLQFYDLRPLVPSARENTRQSV